MSKADKQYIQFNGLLYRTVWTLGCPFNCSYCANDSFIRLDKEYRKLRYSSAEYITNEIKNAIKINPFISTVGFYDDNLITLPVEQLQKFVEIYKRDIHLPFVVFGIHPNTIDKVKIDLLASAGMNRMRMGIQSGSEAILKFFNRKTPLKKVKEAVEILAATSVKYKMIPPAYDIITDNPVETVDNKLETLNFLFGLARPYTLNIFSLRVFPKTQLYDYVQLDPSLNAYFNNTSYLHTKKNLYNIMLFLLATFKPSSFVFNYVSGRIKNQTSEKEYPIFFAFVKTIYFGRRAFEHLSRFDFSTIVGKWIYYIWSIKRFFQRKKK